MLVSDALGFAGLRRHGLRRAVARALSDGLRPLLGRGLAREAVRLPAQPTPV